ncbi:hypothetical protein EXS86_04400 [Helicobacter pylori]|nr:hypothetical protein [Helicobacter pylori]
MFGFTTINGRINGRIRDKDNSKSYCHIFPFKNLFSYENCTFQTFKSNHYTTLIKIPPFLNANFLPL